MTPSLTLRPQTRFARQIQDEAASCDSTFRGAWRSGSFLAFRLHLRAEKQEHSEFLGTGRGRNDGHSIGVSFAGDRMGFLRFSKSCSISFKALS